MKMLRHCSSGDGESMLPVKESRFTCGGLGRLGVAPKIRQLKVIDIYIYTAACDIYLKCTAYKSTYLLTYAQRILQVFAVSFIVHLMCYEQVIPTTDRIEGIQAFMEKRPPHYVGE